MDLDLVSLLALVNMGLHQDRLPVMENMVQVQVILQDMVDMNLDHINLLVLDNVVLPQESLLALKSMELA